MIDIKHLVTNTDIYTQELAKRNKDTTLANQLAKAYNEYLSSLKTLDESRQIKNQFNQTVITLQGEKKQEAIIKMKEVSDTIKTLESSTDDLKSQVDTLLYKIPNLTAQEVPVGPTDESNVEIALFATKPTYSFTPKHYHELPVFAKNYMGPKGVEAFGTRGYYIKGDLALLQKALFQYIMDSIIDKGFDYVIPPIMVNEKTMYGTGFFPDGIEDSYKVLASDKEFYLVGTSEAPLMFMNSNMTLDLTTPVLLTAQTPCFRKEAGSYGKDTQGGIRVHQFDKIETVAICKPEESPKIFDLITKIFTDNVTALGLHTHHLEVCTGDISIKNNRQIDIEAWFPAQDTYRELASSSNCTDYQTRNLAITYINDKGEKSLAHSLNCTGVTNRTMFAILEQFQNEDGSVTVPEVLVKYLNKTTLI
jgi:seryl-tRNA synthetase